MDEASEDVFGLYREESRRADAVVAVRARDAQPARWLTWLVLR